MDDKESKEEHTCICAWQYNRRRNFQQHSKKCWLAVYYYKDSVRKILIAKPAIVDDLGLKEMVSDLFFRQGANKGDLKRKFSSFYSKVKRPTIFVVERIQNPTLNI